MLAKILKSLNDETRRCDWSDPVQIASFGKKFLPRLAAPKVLSSALRNVIADDRLLCEAERNEIFERIVLHYDKRADIKIRLHIFRENSLERLHNHRWPFVTMILRGGYTQEIFSREAVEDRQGIANPLYVGTHKAGDIYAFSDCAYHCLRVERGTVSLVIRGPICRATNTDIERTTGKKWTVYGAREIDKMGEAHARPEKLCASEVTDILSELAAARLVS